MQKYLESFHDTIKLGTFEENATLREKRDIIRKRLEDRLPGVFEKYGETCPDFSLYDQGSYELGTGIKPCDGQFDIDQGLYFSVSIDEYPDPVKLKLRVFEALEGHTDEVRMRQPCVTVFYKGNVETAFHVDIAVYADGSKDADRKTRLARGKQYSSEENRYWEVSDQFGLREAIHNHFQENERKQFKRIVRYLKRWKDENFSGDGHAAPRGIALTILAYELLQWKAQDSLSGKPDDLQAMRDLIRATLNRFVVPTWDQDEQRIIWRLEAKLPVEPGNDLFEKLTNKQMETFKGEVENLLKSLDEAANKVDPVEACEVMQKVFGADFPVPPKEATARKHSPAIISSSSSA